MRNIFWIALAAIIFSARCPAQEEAAAQTAAPAAIPRNQQASTIIGMSQQEPPAAESPSGDSLHAPAGNPGLPPRLGETRFSYYMKEAWLNPSVLTAPTFRASVRMANPPGHGLTRYPNEWRQGVEGFGRNFGDTFAARISAHTAQFLTGVLTGEDPNYIPSTSTHFLVRSSHALMFTFVDRSISGRRLPALSNFAGAAAGGFVGNAYLPDGFRDLTHAGQRATFQFEVIAAGNLFREFAPQVPVAMRGLISLIAR